MLTFNDVTHLSSRLACVVGLLVFPIVGCGDLSDAAGAGGLGGVAGSGGTDGTGGAGGTACIADPGARATLFLETHEPGGPVLEGVRICEVGTGNCTTSNDQGKATLELPRCKQVAWTLEKEGFDPALAGDVTDDTFDPGPHNWTLRTVEEIQDWADELEISYPWTAGYLRALPTRAGVTLRLIGGTGEGFYMDEPYWPRVDLNATTSVGDGGFVGIAPGEIEVEFGGTATDCVASMAWTSQRPNTIRLPVQDGFYTYASMRCGEQ